MSRYKRLVVAGLAVAALCLVVISPSPAGAYELDFDRPCNGSIGGPNVVSGSKVDHIRLDVYPGVIKIDWGNGQPVQLWELDDPITRIRVFGYPWQTVTIVLHDGVGVHSACAFGAKQAVIDARDGGSHQGVHIETDDGDDLIFGSDGPDTILAGPGHDEVNAGPGADTVYGGPGNDVIDLGAGPGDSVDGGKGIDRCIFAIGSAPSTPRPPCENIHEQPTKG